MKHKMFWGTLLCAPSVLLWFLLWGDDRGYLAWMPSDTIPFVGLIILALMPVFVSIPFTRISDLELELRRRPARASTVDSFKAAAAVGVLGWRADQDPSQALEYLKANAVVLQDERVLLQLLEEYNHGLVLNPWFWPHILATDRGIEVLEEVMRQRNHPQLQAVKLIMEARSHESPSS